ncbi:MAG: DUF3035 domain-containing protein [Acetobacteraceae bacterium]|nr:DUF3035 domain-containing protein [Acetobacteraceae bacterium]
MTRRLKTFLPALSLLLLVGCGENTARTLGFIRDAPDEFRVTTRAPLSMPPDMAGGLPPPRPGAPRPMERSARDEAEAVLVPSLALRDPRQQPRAVGGSVGEVALLQAAGPAPSRDIRRQVDEESQRLDRPPRDLADRLIFWRDPPAPGIVVDPARERERIRENAALGIEGTAGDTPIQQPRAQSWWQRLGF